MTIAAGTLLKRARAAAGMSQSELAHVAGVPQSVISVYEAGKRQPSVPTLAALVDATGMRLRLSVEPRPVGLARLEGPLGARLRRHRSRVRALLSERGMHLVGVFGSVARGEEGPSSDVDLLVTVDEGVGLFTMGWAREALEQLLGAPVDLVPEDGLKPTVREDVRRDLVAL